MKKFLQVVSDKLQQTDETNSKVFPWSEGDENEIAKIAGVFKDFADLWTTVLPRNLAPVSLFENVLMFRGQVHVNILETLSNFVEAVYKTVTLTSIVKAMYQFVYTDSYPTSSTF